MERSSMLNWPALAASALAALETGLRVDRGGGVGLRQYQVAVARHVIEQLKAQPGIIVAERTGQGKSQIAMAIAAAVATAIEDRPLRIGLLAPNGQVLENWVGPGRLLDTAFGLPDAGTYLWERGAVPLTVWSRGSKRIDIEGTGAGIEVFADHYTRGITNGFGAWKNSEKLRDRQADQFMGGRPSRQLDLLIVDEGHQLRSSWNARAQAIQSLFGKANSPIQVGRVLMLTATPFQLRAAPELARLANILRYPAAHGGVDFPVAVASSLSATAVSQLFDRYRRAFTHWLRQLAAGLPTQEALERARVESERVGQVLRTVIVRTDAPTADLRVRYGRPDPTEASDKPMAASGLVLEDPVERLLFLAWDGSIASRTTFVATEQQTLSSSVSALGARDFEGLGRSAAEKSRRPLAPPSVQQALASLSKELSKRAHDKEHCKVRATVAAVASRLQDDPERRPVLVFAERTLTLQRIRAAIEEALGDHVTVEVLDGGVFHADRERVVDGFRAADEVPRVHVLLASKVAEMGLDIDGPKDKDDIWLIHHDFPWNPAMVDQRNGRVTRPAKGDTGTPVFIMYPFIRDSVDERIFKRMLARQAFAEILLGTDDAVRALGLAVHENLQSLELEALDPQVIRQLTPNLRPGTSVKRGASMESPAVKASATGSAAVPPGGRPDWCPGELLELLDEDETDKLDRALTQRIQEFAAGQACSRWEWGTSMLLRVDLEGRGQTVAVRCRAGVVEALSLADAEFDPELVLDVLQANFAPGVAGLVSRPDGEGGHRLFARATNALATLDESELRLLVLDAAVRADDWEKRRHGELDRW